MILLGLLLFAALGADESWESVEVLARESRAPKYARWAGLSALTDASDISEVRVWHSVAAFGTVNGWVIRSGRYALYSNERLKRGVIYAGDDLRLSTTRRRIAANGMMIAFSTLADLDRESLGCPAKDGASIDVEGVLRGRYFSFSSTNPWTCEKSGASAVVEAFARLVDTAGFSEQ